MKATKWVLTFATSDGKTIHAEDRTPVLLREILQGVLRTHPEQEYWLRVMPATWECDGRDNCEQSA